MTVAEQLEAKGRKEGSEETAAKVASNLFKLGMTVDFVTKATGSPVGDLEQILARST